ncbi:MAG: type II secretion system protein [Armatimonadetes bacterium]|nr:type II secretion system protein [Armatimonadota bacterium]
MLPCCYNGTIRRPRTPNHSPGFTLVELLVVLAIVAVLSALLFPVFRSAKALGKRSVCLSDFRQVATGTMLYLTDYDDRFMPVNYRPSMEPDPLQDKTWVQVLMPYTQTLRLYKCPEDASGLPGSDAVFEEGSLVGDTYERYYRASLVVNVGYNYLYYSPVVWEGGQWQVLTRTIFQVADPSRSNVFIDSVHELDGAGIPRGGNYVVIPPCRYQKDANRVLDSFGVGSDRTVFTASKGWTPGEPDSPFRYGFAWPWHTERVSVARIGGGAAAIPIHQLSAGCDVQPEWSGFIKDQGSYSWDLN